MQIIGTLEIGRVQGHPRNRSFVKEGGEWLSWLEDIKANGIQSHIVVRPVGADVEAPDFYQIVKGHRRHAAAVQLEFATVPVIVKVLSDEEALKELFRDHLLCERLDPWQEGEAVVALMEDLGATPEAVAGMVNRSVEWVRTRQLMLSLGDEVRECVRRPKGDERHLDMGTVEVLLAVREDMREEAVQLVLHCDLFEGLPRRKEAEMLVRQGLVEPKLEEEAWTKGLAKLVKEWKGKLREALGKAGSVGMNVLGVEWAKREDARRGSIVATSRVDPSELTEEAPLLCTWADLAIRNLQPVMVVPDVRDGTLSLAVVNEVVIRQLEDAAAQAGQTSWLQGKRRAKGGGQRDGEGEEKGRVPSDQSAVISETAEGEGRVGEAMASLEGESSPAWEREDVRRDERDSAVVEQSLERHTVIRMDVVTLLKQEAEFARDAGLYFPWDLDEGKLRGWPEWAKEMDLVDVIAICDWVLSLKYTPGA